jgi:hypothetical protein
MFTRNRDPDPVYAAEQGHFRIRSFLRPDHEANTSAGVDRVVHLIRSPGR